MHVQSGTLPRRLAAVAPERPERESCAMPAELDWLCIRWAGWCRTRRFYGAPHERLQSVIGQLRTARSTAPDLGPGIASGRDLATFHQGVLALPERERLVLEAHYLHRARPIKRVAVAMGCSRATFYRLLIAAAERAHATSLALMQPA